MKLAGKRILLVEGPDDQHVMTQLCRTRGIREPDEVWPLGGISQLLESIPVRLKASQEGDIVGVVVDADEEIRRRWDSLRRHLGNFGYVGIPKSPDPRGTIVTPPVESLLPRVGIWIMPDNRTGGILEDFLRFLVPADSRLFEHAETAVASIPQEEVRFPPVRRPKALIHTWLAWQEEPGKPLGTAISARFLDPDVPVVDLLMDWLDRLFYRQ